MNIRMANVEDVPAIAGINFTTWNETYRGIIDEAFLDKLDVEQYKRKWSSFFNRPAGSTGALLVVENDEGIIVGYCCAGKVMHPFHDFDGELTALYLLKKYHGKGWGKQLFILAMKGMEKQGFKSCCLLVLKDNPTANFYRSFKPDMEEIKNTKIGDKEYPEVGLGWNSLSGFFK